MATAAPAAPEPSDMDCSVCHKPFTEPKLLPCGHLLCRHCLVAWLQSQAEALCPLCRCVLVEGGERGERSWQDVADALSTDLAMADLVNAHRLLKQTHSCCLCEEAPATRLCLTCGDLFCGPCQKLHVKQKVARQHRAEDLSALTAEQVAGSQHSPCAQHADHTAELFCPTHGHSICHLCAASRHRGCPEVQDMEEKVKEARAVLGELAARLSEGEARLDRAIQELDLHLAETEKKTEAAIAEMETLCQRLERSLQACRHRLSVLAHGACSDVKEAVSEAKTCLLQRRGRLTTHRHVVLRVQGAENRHTVSTMTPVMQTRVGRLDFSVTLPANAKVVSKVTLVIDLETLTRIEKELSGLGQMKTTPVNIGFVPILSFHVNQGRNIELSNNHQTARRKGSAEDYGIVVASQPMMPNMLYEIVVDQKDSSDGSLDLWVGATAISPDALELSITADLLKSSVVIHASFVRDTNGQQHFSDVGQKLRDLPEKSRVGLMLDENRSLHLYINGEDQGIAETNMEDPCFAFFDVYYPYIQITALPVRRIR